MYKLARKLLFKFDPETAHHLALEALSTSKKLGISKLTSPKPVAAPVKVMGIDFPNAVGLAAGLDKNADYLAALDSLGFGFIEVGTVTPLAQAGNPQPRLFRLEEHQAIINRMGFNNKGLDYLIGQVKNQPQLNAKLGINIGKNLNTPVEKALDDYLIGLNGAYPHADYITVNISSPNTPGLRSLQYGEALKELLAPLKQRQQQLAEEHSRYVPLAVKVAPDMNQEEVISLAQCLLELKLDGVIATNTSLDKSLVAGHQHAEEAGGLSGKPIKDASLAITRQLADALEGQLPIIGVGGINSAADAQERLAAGASLVQIYTGFIYQGPNLISDCAQAAASYRA